MQIIKDGEWKKALLLLRLAKEENHNVKEREKLGQ